MAGVSLRQKPAFATEQNASASIRPVSGTPLWARNDHAPGTPRPASPWDVWVIPPKPTALERTRKPSPHPAEPAAPTAPAEPAEPAEPFRPWRIDAANPDVVEYPCLPEHLDRPGDPERLERSERAVVEPSEPATVARKLFLLLGLAYLFVAALASGLACTGYFAMSDPNPKPGDREPDRSGEDTEAPPGRVLPPRPRPPSRDPDAPGLHTRPDGTRYLVMPLPADIADRFRDRADAVHSTVPAMGGATS